MQDALIPTMQNIEAKICGEEEKELLKMQQQ
jgi:hypothetical protein